MEIAGRPIKKLRGFGICYLISRPWLAPRQQMRRQLLAQRPRRRVVVAVARIDRCQMPGHALGCGESAIRFCPPLCISAEQVETALKLLREIIRENT